MERLRVAICGGGIASICLAHVLCQQQQLDVKIFEASNIFREDGAAVGLGSNAQQALALLSPALRSALDEAGGTRMDPSVRIMMGTGPDSGRHVGDIRPAVPQIVVHRGPFLRALRKRIPDDVLEMGKRLTGLESAGDIIRLSFEDNTTYEADAVIGCDGINSTARKAVLGVDHPAASPAYTGGYNHRVVIPIETAIAAFGEEYCKLRTQHGWVGENGFLLTDLVDDAKAMQVVAGWTTKEPWPHSAPFIEWPKDRIRRDLQDWGTIGEAMTKVFTEQPKLYAAGGRTHFDTPTYTKGQICLVGDAAQSFPPFQGAGAGQAIEDALILSSVMSVCFTRDDIVKAFSVYDSVRRPRRSNVAETSRWAAMLFTGRAEGIGLDVERIAEQLPSWGANIYDYDLEGARDKAVEQMLCKE